MFLIAEFGDSQSVARAIAALKARGVAADSIDLFSTEPVALPEGLLDRPSRMSLAAVAGAACMFLLTVLFVHYTQYNYPLITGGMPLFSWWATGVIFYELTMFGSIITTFAVFLRESGLFTRRPAPAPTLISGRILARVCCEADSAAAVTGLLRNAGAATVAELERS